MTEKELLDHVAEAIQKRELKAGFMIIQFETGDDKVFKGIEKISLDLTGDNKQLAETFFEESGLYVGEKTESEFIDTLADLIKEHEKKVF